MSKTIRVLLVDDHPAVRIGLRVLLEQAPDVAVVDCELPEVAGTEVAWEIRRQESATQVLALSSYDDEYYVRGMLEAGAVGYLLKEEAPQTIVAAVRTAAEGDGYFSPGVAGKVDAWTRREPPGGLPSERSTCCAWWRRGTRTRASLTS